MIFFKKSKIVVDTFTCSSMAYEWFPIESAQKYIPEWWKKLPSSYELKNPSTLKDTALTIKKCPGVVDLFTTGFIMPLWTDLVMVLTPEQNMFNYEFAARSPYWFIDLNEHRQYLNAFENKFLQAKITSPWCVKEKDGVQFTLLEPTWMMDDPNAVTIVPGILDFKYQNNINVNVFLKMSATGTRVDLKAGSPLAHFIPLSDKKVEVKNHLVSEQEYKNLNDAAQPFSFSRSFITRKKIINARSKCPFARK